MSPLKIIVPGVMLLLLAAAGFIYVLARQKPPLESLEPVELRLVKETPVPTIEPENPTPTTRTVTRVVVQQPPPIKTFAVKILSPSMAETFTAPAKVVLRASANRKSGLKSIEFFNSPSETVCRSLTNPAPFPAELKIGEAHAAPYEITWSIPKPDTRTIVAVANYEGGEKEISAPVVIIVNPAEPYDGPNWKGWRPPYPTDQQLDQDFSLMPAPTPTPTRDSCPTIVVKSLPVSPDSNTINFQATVSGNEVPPDLTYQWKVSAGEIISGQGTARISVVFDKTLDPRVVAAVEIGRLHGICPTFGSASVAFEQPRWITKELRALLRQLRDSITEEHGRIAHRYIELRGERDDCVDEDVLKQARLLKRYLVEYQGAKNDDVTIINGGSEDYEFGSLWLTNVPRDEPTPVKIEEKLRKQLAPCRGLHSASAKDYGPPINRRCPDVEDTINYTTTLEVDREGNDFDWRREEINTCPYNPRDPLNTGTQLTLRSLFLGGTYSNFPSFEYWAEAGRILSKQQQGIWDLSEVKLKPGYYTAIAIANDGCDCTNVDMESARVTTFCSPCLTMRRTCSSAPETRGLQFYSAEVGGFAVAEKTVFHWTTTKGTIISGQGSPNIVIDTRALPNGDRFVVTVTASGLLPYCVNKVSQPAMVEEFECKRIEVFAALPGMYGSSKRAGRRPRPEETITTIEKVEDATGSPGQGTVHRGPPRTNGKEWMRISWTPRVKTDEAVTVKVVYNRTTETFQVSDEAGNISEEMKLGKLLSEWFGEDHQTLGDVRLTTAGLRCDSCNREQYQSFDKEKLEWSWPLKPEGTGTHSFNVELWVKGEPRDTGSGSQSQPAEKVWSRIDNKVIVTDPFLTRQTVYAGSGLCAVIGLGLCLRGLKIYRVGDTYNVGQAVAVGRNVSMPNAVINQQAANKDIKNGENRDA